MRPPTPNSNYLLAADAARLILAPRLCCKIMMATSVSVPVPLHPINSTANASHCPAACPFIVCTCCQSSPPRQLTAPRVEWSVKLLMATGEMKRTDSARSQRAPSPAASVAGWYLAVVGAAARGVRPRAVLAAGQPYSLAAAAAAAAAIRWLLGPNPQVGSGGGRHHPGSFASGSPPSSSTIGVETMSWQL